MSLFKIQIYLKQVYHKNSYIFKHIKKPNYPTFRKYFFYMNIDASYNYFFREGFKETIILLVLQEIHQNYLNQL